MRGLTQTHSLWSPGLGQQFERQQKQMGLASGERCGGSFFQDRSAGWGQCSFGHPSWHRALQAPLRLHQPGYHCFPRPGDFLGLPKWFLVAYSYQSLYWLMLKNFLKFLKQHLTSVCPIPLTKWPQAPALAVGGLGFQQLDFTWARLSPAQVAANCR